MQYRNILTFVVLFSALLLSGIVLAQPVVSLPMDHWLTPVLERWAIAGWAPDLSVTEQPYTRQEAAEAVHKLAETAQSRGDELSAGDQVLLERAKVELSSELSVLKKRDEASGNAITNLVRKAKEFLGMNGGDDVNHLNYYIEPQVFIPSKNTGDSATGSASLRLGFAPVPTFVGVTGMRVFRYQTGVSYPQPHWDQVAIEMDDTYLRFASGNFRITYGNEQRQIGVPGITPLILNGNTTGFPALDFRFNNRAVTARMIWGQLNKDVPGIERSILLKRVEYHPQDWWGVGLTDGTVIEHSTGLDWVYLLPVPNIVGLNSQKTGTVTASERVGVDCYARVGTRVLIGGEALLADFSHVDQAQHPTRNFGYRISLNAIDPAGIPGGQAVMEYARVLPFLYNGAGDTIANGMAGTRWMQRNEFLGGEGTDYEQFSALYRQLLVYGVTAEIGGSYAYRLDAPYLIGHETEIHGQIEWIATNEWKISMIGNSVFDEQDYRYNSVGLSARYYLHLVE